MDNPKKRHWALTVYLVLATAILSLTFIAYRYIGTSTAYIQKFSNAPSWALPALRYLCLFHIVCLSAIFRWKKWGYWGAITASVLSVIINIVIEGKLENLAGLIGIAILYGVLQIGGERKGWTQLA